MASKMQVFWIAVFALLQMTSALSVISRTTSDADIPKRERRWAQRSCSKSEVFHLTETARKTCYIISTVDKYIADIQSRKHVEVPSFPDRHGFKAIFSQYNGDITTAQEHCHPWRNGEEDIVASLKKVVLVAQGFEPKFRAGFTKNEARLKDLLENHEEIAAVEARIATLQKDIDEAKETAKYTDIPAVLSHLESVIKTKEEEINTAVKEHKVTQGKLKLAELVKYLDFVKTGAVEIEDEAEDANTKLSNFRENITRDAGAFKRHRSNTQQGITKLQQEKENNNKELQNNRNSITTLRAKIAEENRQIASLNAQIQNLHREVREIEDRINRNMKRTKKKRRFGRWFRFVPVVGWTIGNKFYKDAKEREQRLANEKRHLISSYTSQVQNLQNHIATRNGDIAQHEGRIRTLEANNREMEKELQHFTQLDVNLHDLEDEISAILPSIASAVNGVSKLKDTFYSIKQNLESIIEKSTEAKTEAEIRNMNYFIYNEIEELECKWEDASIRLENVSKCL